MDRLQEANKVASLMRRRENPKPIAVTPVARWSGVDTLAHAGPEPGRPTFRTGLV